MGDWRDLPAGLELDRVIAERSGWKEIEVREIWEEDHYSDGFYKRLFGLPPVKTSVLDVAELIPRYSTDLNGAFHLPVTDLHFMDLHSPTGDGSEPQWNAFVEWKWKDGEYPDCRATAETGALALCRAWLVWKEMQNG
jgi:hypothetical protein